MSNLTIQVEPMEGVDGGALAHLEGALDQPTLNTFRERLDELRNEGKTHLILDMQGVTYANSTALGALVTQSDAFHEAGGELALLNPQPSVNLVIEMLGLDSILPIFASLDEARSHLAAPPSKPAPEPQAPSGTKAAPFPARSDCVECGVALEFSRPGRFRCPHCGALYSVDQIGRTFGSKPRGGRPVEVTLICQPQILSAFAHFVGALPNWPSFSDADRTDLEDAITEVCHAIHQVAYGGNDEATFRALLVCRDNELAIRVADHGKPLGADAFPRASAIMDEFEHRPHPTRGNLLKMAKRASTH